MFLKEKPKRPFKTNNECEASDKQYLQTTENNNSQWEQTQTYIQAGPAVFTPPRQFHSINDDRNNPAISDKSITKHTILYIMIKNQMLLSVLKYRWAVIITESMAHKSDHWCWY